MVVPYSKWQSLTRTLGLTFPFSVAEVWATAEAASVVTLGGGPRVVNVRSEPVLSPPPGHGACGGRGAMRTGHCQTRSVRYQSRRPAATSGIVSDLARGFHDRAP